METLNPAHSLLVTLRDFDVSLRGHIQYECKYKLIYFRIFLPLFCFHYIWAYFPRFVTVAGNGRDMGIPRQDISVMLMRPTLKLIADERTVQSGITAWTDATRARPRCRHEITRGLRSVERGRKLTRNRFKAFIYTSSNRRWLGQRPAAAAIRQRERERETERQTMLYPSSRSPQQQRRLDPVRWTNKFTVVRPSASQPSD